MSFHSCLQTTTASSSILPLLCLICAKKKCLMSNHPNKAEMQICVSLYLPWSSLRACLFNTINRSWFQRVWSQQRDEKKIHVLCLFPVFVRLVKQPTEMHNCAIVCVHWDLQTYWRMRGDFASQPQPTVRKSATQENWADLRRRVCVGLCDRWSYSGAVLRAEWISQIILWVMRSGLVAHKSTGGLKPRSPKGKTASSCFFFL